MKLKRFLFIFLALMFLAINLDSVNAIIVVEKGGMPSSTGSVISISESSSGWCLYYNANSNLGMGKYEDYCNDNSKHTYFRFRYTFNSGDNYTPICVSGQSLASPTETGASCHKSNTIWDDTKSIAMAYILINNDPQKGAGSYLSQSDQFYSTYYWGEVIANEYLGYDMGTGGNDEKVAPVIAAATAYTNSVSNYNIGLDAESLSFTLNEGNYVSNVVKVTHTNIISNNSNLDENDFNVVVTGSQNAKAIVDKNNNSFYVKVPASDIVLGTPTNISVIVTSSSTYYTTLPYDCEGGNTVQDVAIHVVEKNTKTAAAKIAGTIITTAPTASLKLSKKDDNGNFVSGATLLLKNSDGSYENQFISTGEEFVVDDLALGKYCLYEIEAPTGYIKSEQVDCITLSSSVSTGELVIENKKNVISISKKDISDKKEIEGAIITILDSDKKPIDLTKDIYVNVTSRNELLDKKVLSWKSTQTLNIITGLPQGTYYLEETMAPEGYGKINTTFAFTINADGTVKLNDSYSNSLVVLEDGNILTLYNEIIEQIVEVPDTAGTARTLYYVLSAVLLAAGGSLVYLVSRKEEM